MKNFAKLKAKHLNTYSQQLYLQTNYITGIFLWIIPNFSKHLVWRMQRRGRSTLLKMELFEKIVYLSVVDYFRKKFHLRCLTRFWIQLWNTCDRRSRLEVFCKKGILENFAKFTGKHLCQSLFFNKVAGLWRWYFLWLLRNF